MNYNNFGRKNPAGTGMYENLPSSQRSSATGTSASSSNRQQQSVARHANDVHDQRDSRQPNLPCRRPFLNDAGQSAMLTGINHSHMKDNKNCSPSVTLDQHRYNDKIGRDGGGEMSFGTSSLSGGVPRFNRAKSEKREIVDSSWFSQSFASTGGPNQTNVNVNECTNQSDSYALDGNCNKGTDDVSLGMSVQDWQNGISVAERKRMFESVITGQFMDGSLQGMQNDNKSFGVAPQPPRRGLSPSSSHLNSDRILSTHHRQQFPYRGSKTTPNISSSSSDEWDFLATLNDILRRENFLPDDDLDFGKGRFLNSSDGPVVSDFSQNFVSVSQGEANRPADANRISTTPTSPMSPRPPRPSRMRAERRKEYARTRSLDAGHFGLSNGLSTSTATNNNTSHEFLGSNNSLLSGSNIDLSTGGVTIGEASASRGYSNYRQNHQHPSSSTCNNENNGSNRAMLSYRSPVTDTLSSPSSNANNNSNNATTSCITVENPFHPSNNLSVMPLLAASPLEYHERQTLVSPVKSSSSGNDAGSGGGRNGSAASASNHFPHFINSSSYNGPLPPRNSITNMPHAGTPGERSITSRQQQHPPLHRLTADFSNNSNFPSPFYNLQQQQQAYRITRSPLVNTVSSSLDSIYERLKANEYLDPIGPSRPLTQVYLDRNFGRLDYERSSSHHRSNGGSGFNVNGDGHNSQPNLFENSNANVVLDGREFHHHQPNPSSGACDENAIRCGGVSRLGQMSPFQPNQMLMGNVTPSPVRMSDRMENVSVGGSLSRCGVLGGSLTSLTGASARCPSNNASNSNITSAGTHSVTTFPPNLSETQGTTGWWNVPGDYRGRSHGSFKVIFKMNG